MEKLRIIVLLVSIMPMILSSIVYLLLKSKRFVRAFFGVETVNQTTWLPWLFITIGWFLVSVVISFLFDL
jgi:hypothetical protein